MDTRYGCEDKDVGHYACQRVNERIMVDGQLFVACCLPSQPHQGVCRT